MNTNESKALASVKTRQFWIEDDDYSKPHTFVELDDVLAALESQPVAGQVEDSDVREVSEEVAKFIDDLVEHQDIDPMIVGLWYMKAQSFVNTLRTTQQPHAHAVEVPSVDDLVMVMDNVTARWHSSPGVLSDEEYSLGLDRLKAHSIHALLTSRQGGQ